MANHSAYSGYYAGSLRLRNYNSIRGVDFTNRKDEIELYRSPEMVNMWKNYKSNNGLCIETRPGLENYKTYQETIYGMSFFTYNNEKHLIVHAGTKLYDNDNVVFDGLAEHKSNMFIYNSKLWLMDTTEYYVYDGETFETVVGYIPITTISRAPLGGGSTYQDVNMLSDYRKNSFCSDGMTCQYNLDVESYDSDYKAVITIDDEVIDNSEKSQVYDGNGYMKYTNSDNTYWYDKENSILYNSDYEKVIDGEVHNSYDWIKYKNSSGTIYWYDPTYKKVYDEQENMLDIEVSTLTKVSDTTTVSNSTAVSDYPYTEYPSEGKIIFSTPPKTPDTDGSDNVVIQFKKYIEGYRERVTHCSMVVQFDNRIFISGNPEWKNAFWYSGLDEPSYIADIDYYQEGQNDSAIKGLVPGNNALWVIKESSQSNTTIWYHTPSTSAVDDATTVKTYPRSHSSITTGCKGQARNFRDTIVFFSDNGLEAISSDVTTEQVITHKSTFVDNKLLNETNYADMWLEEYGGYLLVFIDNKVYLADGIYTPVNHDHYEYEWFYWELEHNIDFTLIDNDIMYLVSDKDIYTLTDTKEDRQVNAVFTTVDDEMDFPQMQKITNKRGCTADVNGTNVILYVKTDKTDFVKIGQYSLTKGRFIPKIKRKKWKSIQLKLEADMPFYFYSMTLESYVTNYLKK